MASNEGGGWSGMGWRSWSDLAWVRDRLEAGADPNSGLLYGGPPLHMAVRSGSPEVVAELAGRVDDVDAEEDGRTVLWLAVYYDRPEVARVLVSAGADPWRPMMAGWSPGRLSLAGPTPDLFTRPPGVPGLTEAEAAAAAESRRLTAALDKFHTEGLSLACVAGIDAAEAARRLEATPAEDDRLDDVVDDPWTMEDDDDIMIVGATDVPGGCVITQPWAYGASMPGVAKRLSKGTVCYGLYANPKSGNQGSITRDGAITGWDLHPGGEAWADAAPDEVLFSYLYRYNAVAYCCAYAGLRLTDARAVTGPPDIWLRLPAREYWH